MERKSYGREGIRMSIDEASSVTRGREVVKRPGETIFRSGDAGRHMYLVLSGKVEIHLESEGKRIPVATLAEGDFFGEMSLLEGLPRSGTAVAVGPCRLLELDEEGFRAHMAADSSLAWRVMTTLSSRLRHANRELTERIGRDLYEAASQLEANAQGIQEGIRGIAASAGEIEGNERRLAGQIKEVERISQEIGAALSFIQQVALQTQILGLNAGIEAARSGEHGRGFSIIAAEIRKLSDQSRDHAEKIAELTGLIATQMSAISAASEDSARRSHEQAAATLQMVESAGEVAALAARLSGIADSLQK